MFFKYFLKILILSFFIFIFQSCVSTQAHWQKKVYKPSKQGIVFYNSNPSLFDSSALQKRRQDAKMKMISFCSPKKSVIVSERKAEEIIGRQTYFNSHQDNPNPSYYKNVEENEKFYKKSVAIASQAILSSSGSQTEQDLVRERIYIKFACE